MDDRPLVDYAKSLDCIHCGLCLNTCPTYRLTGAEASSPRGRIHLMRAVAESKLVPDADFADEMEFCLLCRHCESVCPSGVRFGAMMEHTRGGLEASGRGRRGLLGRLARWLGFRVLLPSPRRLRLAVALAGSLQRNGLFRIFNSHLGARGKLLASAPEVPPAAERAPLPARTPAQGERRGAVALLEGCVMPLLHGRVNRATVRALAAAGLEVRVPAGHACCGSLHAHNGDLEGARRLARETIAAFDAQRGDDGAPLPVVTNSAGCGAHLKELGALLEADPEWKARAAAVAARVRDLAELLDDDAARARLATAYAAAPTRADLGRATYDDPCHACHGQGLRREARRVLDAIPGLERVELPRSESCCGSAGIYSIVRPEASLAILEEKLDDLAATGARTLVTSNPGCHVQWETGVRHRSLSVRVLHLAEVVDAALGGAPPAR